MWLLYKLEMIFVCTGKPILEIRSDKKKGKKRGAKKQETHVSRGYIAHL